MTPHLRSVLYVPASNAKALAKINTIDADAIIIDLEDAVAAPQKESARAAALRVLRTPSCKVPFRAVRVNALSTSWGEADLLALAPEAIDALVIPKVESAEHLRQVRRVMGRSARVPGRPAPALWAMVETPRCVLNLEDIAVGAKEVGLTTLVAGTNDLAKDLGCDGLSESRQALWSHLSTLVLVARVYGLTALDGVFNAFADKDGFEREALQGRRFGFDGKTLIHPAQLGPAKRIFGPDEAAIKRARSIVRAFNQKNNAGKGVISLNGEMVEILHWHEAQRLLDSLPVKSAQPSSRAKRDPKRKK